MSDGPGAWAQLRAALVALHVAAVVLAAVPAPEGAMRRSAWQDPTVQDELRAWAERLRGLGLELSDAAFQERLWQVAARYTAARRAALAPFQPYYRYLGVHQSWRMFVAPHRYPSRLHIEVREGQTWRTVYVARAPDQAWLGEVLDNHRMRSALFRYAWPQYGRTWRELGDWVAARAAVDFPTASHVRLRYWKQRTPSPQEARAGREPRGEWTRAREVPLAPLRPAAPAPR